MLRAHSGAKKVHGYEAPGGGSGRRRADAVAVGVRVDRRFRLCYHVRRRWRGCVTGVAFTGPGIDWHNGAVFVCQQDLMQRISPVIRAVLPILPDDHAHVVGLVADLDLAAEGDAVPAAALPIGLLIDDRAAAPLLSVPALREWRMSGSVRSKVPMLSVADLICSGEKTDTSPQPPLSMSAYQPS